MAWKRLTEKHQTHQRVQQVFDLMDEIGLAFFVQNNTIYIEDAQELRPYSLTDIEVHPSCSYVSELPPSTEWHLCYDSEE